MTLDKKPKKHKDKYGQDKHRKMQYLTSSAQKNLSIVITNCPELKM